MYIYIYIVPIKTIHFIVVWSIELERLGGCGKASRLGNRLRIQAVLIAVRLRYCWMKNAYLYTWTWSKNPCQYFHGGATLDPICFWLQIN